jgi:hypothetical protein
MTVPHVKLSQVGIKALKEPDFFKKLVATRENPDATQAVLAEYDMTLSPEDSEKLRRALHEPAIVKFDLSKFLNTVHERGLHERGLFSDGVDWTGFCTDWFDPQVK